MESYDNTEMLDQVPVMYVRGTNYQIGLSMGRSFKGMIHDFYSNWDFFNNFVVPNYSTLAGKQTYDDALRLCEIRFPRYVEELRGIAEGAGVPFHKVFMLHIDTLTTAPSDNPNKQTQADSGCSSILCNADEVIVAQNEDAFPECVNRFYIVVAEVLDDDGNKLEKFAALTYCGFLPGFSIGFNEKGVVHSVNTLVAKDRYNEGSPRWFVTRALLGAGNHEEMVKILEDEGTGVADGFSVNVCYMGETADDAEMCNIEVAPPPIKDFQNAENRKSQISVRKVPRGESHVHCNRYLHLKVREHDELLTSTIHRHAAISKLPSPTNMQKVKDALSNQSDVEFPVYRRFQKGDKDGAKTVATGIFDIGKRKWSIYVHPPSSSEPVAVIPMDL